MWSVLNNLLLFATDSIKNSQKPGLKTDVGQMLSISVNIHAMEYHIRTFFFAKILSLFFRFTKTRCLRNSVFSLYENKVLQLIASGASLERFGEKDLVFIK